MKNIILKAVILFSSVILLITTSCTKEESESASDAKSITIISGNDQTGQPGEPLENIVEVLVKDQHDNAFAETIVHFSVTEGLVSPTSAQTDARGIASTSWTLGQSTGTQTLGITAFKTDGTTPLLNAPLSAIANVEGEQQEAASLELVSGDNQTGIVNEPLANPIIIRVLDQFENPFAGATVTYIPDGSEDPSTRTSDANGLVSINWTLSGLVNTQNLTVTSFKPDGTTPLTGSPLTITATGTSATVFADILQLVSGDNQTGTVNEPLANPIIIRVLDQFGNPFAGASVSVLITVDEFPFTLISDANGLVSINWTLSGLVNTQNMTVTSYKADGTTPLTGAPIAITATGEAAIEADILINTSGNNQTGTVGATLASPIVVRVLDQFENPLAGATVNFATTDGSVSASSGVSNASGNVSVNWTLGSTIGTQTLTVTAFKADGTTPLSGSPLTITASGNAALAIGDFHEGGVIFYLDNTGEHGLVCAVSNQSDNAPWGCNGTSISGADGTTIGSGFQNTQDVINGCTESLIAVEYCSSLNLNGFNDWFLPSLDELNQLLLHKTTVDATATANGGNALDINFYWSSTEINASNAAGYNVFGDTGKSNSYAVRAIRSF